MRNAGTFQIVGIAFVVCAVCGVVVSTTSVLMKEGQDRNKLNDKKKFVLAAAGIVDKPENVDPAQLDELFSEIETRLIDVETGEIVVEDDLEAMKFDVRKASQAGEFHQPLTRSEDPAKIKRMSKRQRVYIKANSDGVVERFVLPIHGKGLWGPMYGFLSLDADGKTIKHLSYYQHQETPGLGAEVDGPVFKRAWPGLIAYDEQGEPQIDVTKSEIPADNESKVASISGATITSNGVEKMVNFWLSDRGYGVFLEKNRVDRAETDAEADTAARPRTERNRALAATRAADRPAVTY